MRRILVALAGLALAAGAMSPVGASAAQNDASPPAAHEVTTVPATGAIFYPSILGLFPTLGFPHFCSGSVVHSPARDLVATAAHCVFGAGPVIEFAPLLHDNALPAGVWAVKQIYIDPAWKKSFDPRHDIAFLRVGKVGGKNLEDVVPGRSLGTPVAGQSVNVSGYPMGSRGRPVTCDAPLRLNGIYSAIGCTGFGDGTSGGPWVQGGDLVGVIGGLEQGGCSADVEYSTPFGADVQALFARAVAGGAGDFVPVGFTANAC